MTRPTSLVMTRIGGKDYPMRVVPQCHCCQSPFRLEIEQALCEGRTYRGLAKSLEGRESESPHAPIPSWKSIEAHYKNGHMPLGPASRRALIEKRAKEVGKSVEDATESLVDHVTANQAVIQAGFERLASGEIKPNVADLLNAIRNQHTIDQSESGGLDQEMWTGVLMEYMEIADRFLPPAIMQEYGRALSRSPVLKAIAKRRADEEAAATASPRIINHEE